MFIYRNNKRHPAAKHIDDPFGVAYETDNYFVHYYLDDVDDICFCCAPSQRIYQKKTGTLNDWIIEWFGAEDIQPTLLAAGETIRHVWRPGIHSQKDIDNSKSEIGNCTRAQLVLLQKLSDIFNFVEPSGDGLKAFGHKTRELLILACTEVESYWVNYLRSAGNMSDRLTTNDYVLLKAPLHLSEFEILRDRLNLPSIFPFKDWDDAQPTRSLNWYNAYNKVKHNRDVNFPLATVENCINSVAASLTMFATRFGPDELSGNLSLLTGLFNEIFSIDIKQTDRKTFYTPKLDIENPGHNNPVYDHCHDRTSVFNIKDFTL